MNMDEKSVSPQNRNRTPEAKVAEAGQPPSKKKSKPPFDEFLHGLAVMTARSRKGMIFRQSCGFSGKVSPNKYRQNMRKRCSR